MEIPQEKFPEVGLTGIEGYNVDKEKAFGFDVNGKWGGHRAVVVHFRPNGVEDAHQDELYLYILVGHYFDVGKWPEDTSDEPSKWDVAELITKAMANGLNRRLLFDAILEIAGSNARLQREPRTSPRRAFLFREKKVGKLICLLLGHKWIKTIVDEKHYFYRCDRCDFEGNKLFEV